MLGVENAVATVSNDHLDCQEYLDRLQSILFQDQSTSSADAAVPMDALLALREQSQLLERVHVPTVLDSRLASLHRYLRINLSGAIGQVEEKLTLQTKAKQLAESLEMAQARLVSISEQYQALQEAKQTSQHQLEDQVRHSVWCIANVPALHIAQCAQFCLSEKVASSATADLEVTL